MKNCWECKYIHMTQGSPGYSEYTPGYDMELFCRKEHWSFSSQEDTTESMREKFEQAETCVDFEHVRKDEKHANDE